MRILRAARTLPWEGLHRNISLQKLHPNHAHRVVDIVGRDPPEARLAIATHARSNRSASDDVRAYFLPPSLPTAHPMFFDRDPNMSFVATAERKLREAQS
jgi:hypothetical protein